MSKFSEQQSWTILWRHARLNETIWIKRWKYTIKKVFKKKKPVGIIGDYKCSVELLAHSDLIFGRMDGQSNLWRSLRAWKCHYHITQRLYFSCICTCCLHWEVLRIVPNYLFLNKESEIWEEDLNFNKEPIPPWNLTIISQSHFIFTFEKSVLEFIFIQLKHYVEKNTSW